MRQRLLDCLRLLRNRGIWGNFPRDMRPYFLAQRGRCPYCDRLLITLSQGSAKFKCKADRKREEQWHASWDHVFPRSRWGNHKGSKIVCHIVCNRLKADRHPHPCEVLFRDITTGIVDEIDRAVTKETA